MSKNNDIEAIEALHRAKESLSDYNYQTILTGFTVKGVPLEQIKPRENVFTFQAWLAQKRIVMKGEKGVKITTWRKKTIKTDKGPVDKTYPVHPTVFHVSQTKTI